MTEHFKKQFIAGASCPQCHDIDVIQLWQPETSSNDQEKWMVCTACGYRAALSEAQTKESQAGEIFRG